MNQVSDYYRRADRRIVLCAFGFVVLWCIVIGTGMRLPYLHTERALQRRVYGLFPILLGGLSYLAFVYKGAHSLTGYRMRINQAKTTPAKVRNTM